MTDPKETPEERTLEERIDYLMELTEEARIQLDMLYPVDPKSKVDK